MNVDAYEEDGVLDQIKKDRGYNYEDVIEISPEKLPNYEEKVYYFICSLIVQSFIYYLFVIIVVEDFLLRAFTH